MNPYDAARFLQKAVRESREYSDLQQAKEELKSDPSAKEMLLDFRRQQLNLQRQIMAGLAVADEQKEKLERLYRIVTMNQFVRNFMEAEYRLSVLMRDIQKVVAESFDLLFDPDLLAVSPEELLGMDGEDEEDAQ